MAITNATFTVGLTFRQTKDVGVAANTPSIPLGLTYTDKSITATKAVVVRVVVAPGTTEEVDLSGAIEDVYGDDASMTAVKAIVINNRSDAAMGEDDAATDLPVTVAGNWIASAFGSTGFELEAGDKVGRRWLNGETVTNSSADTISFENTDGYDNAYIDVEVLGD